MNKNTILFAPLSFLGIKATIDLMMFVYLMTAFLSVLFFSIVLKFYIKRSKINFLYKLFFSVGFFLYDLQQEAFNKRPVDYFSFSKFYYIFFTLLFANLLVLIPFLEEPTQNINVTFGFAICTFLIIHIAAYKINRNHYLHHWIKAPLTLTSTSSYSVISKIELALKFLVNTIITICFFPIELLSRSSLILSLSFRLYGNIFGGAMIASLVKMLCTQSLLWNLIGTVSGLRVLILLFFGLIEGTIQALVFTMISINNLGLMIGDDEE